MSKVDLRKLVEDIDDFNDWSHTEKVQLFAWYLHTY